MYDYKKEMEKREIRKEEITNAINERFYFGKVNEKNEHLMSPQNSYIPTETIFLD